MENSAIIPEVTAEEVIFRPPAPEPGAEWHEKAEKCYECGGPNGVYAKHVVSKWRSYCWACIKPPLTEVEIREAKRKDDDVSDSTVHEVRTAVAPMDAPAVERREVAGKQKRDADGLERARVVPRLPKQSKTVHHESKRKRGVHRQSAA